MFHAFVYLYNFVLGYGLYEDQGHHSSQPQEEYEKVRFYGCLSIQYTISGHYCPHFFAILVIYKSKVKP